MEKSNILRISASDFELHSDKYQTIREKQKQKLIDQVNYILRINERWVFGLFVCKCVLYNMLNVWNISGSVLMFIQVAVTSNNYGHLNRHTYIQLIHDCHSIITLPLKSPVLAHIVWLSLFRCYCRYFVNKQTYQHRIAISTTDQIYTSAQFRLVVQQRLLIRVFFFSFYTVPHTVLEL